jgi:hypothetical protein
MTRRIAVVLATATAAALATAAPAAAATPFTAGTGTGHDLAVGSDGGRRLSPGLYQARLTITDAAGNVSRTERLRFRVRTPPASWSRWTGLLRA